ncbi:DUF1642 domain-containing protein [Enterococcus faecalis]|nr:DUF1642 domain-containing protein [Enterococcus faecalis]EKZ0214401.1 DUF1642 domain-containing protein [Enterococcus faecalis]
MAKKELIEKWESKEGVPSYEISAFPVNPSLNEMYIAGYGVARKEILDDLKQLDEPKKVVVPQFVAEWLDKHKYSTDIIDLFLSVEYATDSDGFIAEKWDYSGEFYDWLNNSADVQFTLCDAMRYGYEVEKEQLYYVKLPEIGYMRFGKKYFYSTDKEDAKRYTENQIKSIDERYWPFAVKVDGE